MNETALFKEVRDFLQKNIYVTIPEQQIQELASKYDSFSKKWISSRGEDRLILTCDFLAKTLLNSEWPTSTNPAKKGGFFKALVSVCDKNEWPISNRAGISFILWIEGCSDCGLTSKRVKYKRCTRCGILHKERVQEHVAARAKLARPQPRPKEPELKSWFELKGLIRASVRGARN